MKPITVERLKEVVRHLPMGYYLGRQLPIIVENGRNKSELAFFDCIRCEIHLGINIINRALKAVDETKTDWTEEKVIRTIVYHEVAHCILSSKKLLEEIPKRGLPHVPLSIKNLIINIFEDERIERLLSALFLGVDFKGLCHAMNDGIDIADKRIQKFFDAVRLGRATPEVLKKINNAIINTRKANAKTGLRNIYEDRDDDWDIMRIYALHLDELYLSIMDMESPPNPPNDESDDKGDDSDNGESNENEEDNDSEDEDNNGSGDSDSDKGEEKNNVSDGNNSEDGECDKDEGDGGDDGNEEGDEESGDKDNGKEKGGGNEKEDEGESGESYDKGNGDSDCDNDSSSDCDSGSNHDDPGAGDDSAGGGDVSNEANKQKDDATGEDDGKNGDDDAPPASPPEGLTEEDIKGLVNAMTNMYEPSYETQSSLKTLSVRLSKKKGVQGCGRWSPMTGKLIPLRDALDADGIFRKSSHEGERMSSSVNLTLWIDKSGSFVNSQDKINSIIKAAVIAEKMSGGHLHLNVCVMDTQCQVCDTSHLEVTCCGGNSITSYFQRCFETTRDKARRNIDIVVFDGYALTDCRSVHAAYEIAGKIWNCRDTYIISDNSNKEIFDDNCPMSIREYITEDYAEHLESTLIKVLNRIM